MELILTNQNKSKLFYDLDLLIFLSRDPNLKLMKKLFFLITLFLFNNAIMATTPAKLQHPLEFIFEKVLEKKHLDKKAEIPFPKFFYESKTSLKQFQDAIERQWGFRPDVITNAFAVANNEIYILDDASYYKKTERCMDDSIAHELTHYLQVKYQNWDLSDESLEWEAIDVQTAFRAEFCKI